MSGAAFADVLSIKSAVVPDPPKFAAGGVVGSGAVVSDAVRIRANSGEMILTAEQQAALFGWRIGNKLSEQLRGLVLALYSALQDLPAPVLITRNLRH